MNEIDAKTSPSGLRLLLTSIAAFSCVVMVGGVIGLILGQTEANELPSTLTAASGVAAVLTPPDAAPSSPSTTTTTALPPTTTAAPETSTRTLLDVLNAGSVSVDVGSVVEFDTVDQQEIPTPVAFVELPKAVYDRFTLTMGDSFSINIAANDKVAGQLESVELTGLGELAPGFVLHPDGSLEGTASKCGRWKAQYSLNSTNPAVGTSWIDLTVVGCHTT